MVGDLLQSAGVIFVVMLGFVRALFARYRDVDTFDLTLLFLFKAMLDEIDLFDYFLERFRDGVATVLLILYLVAINIMFLRLLIAILSTIYSKVEENAKREFKISKTRVMHYYEMLPPEKDMLPPPFNFIQLASTGLFMAPHACYLSFLSVLTDGGDADRNAEQVRRMNKTTMEIDGHVVL